MVIRYFLRKFDYNKKSNLLFFNILIRIIYIIHNYFLLCMYIMYLEFVTHLFINIKIVKNNFKKWKSLSIYLHIHLGYGNR